MTVTSPPEIAKIGHAALVTPDLEASHHFVHDLLGLDEVERRDGTIYYRAWGEFEHHSLSLREEALQDHMKKKEELKRRLEEKRAQLIQAQNGNAPEEAEYAEAV